MKEHKHRERYGQWAGNPGGHKANLERCIEEVSDNWIYHQCSRKLGHGPEGMYCKQHAKRFANKGGEDGNK
jgi:hypothetical protein